LDEVVLLVHDDQTIRIHEAVRDEPSHRRRDRDALELEPTGSFHQMKQSIVLLDEARDDSRRDLTGRGVEGTRRLYFASSIRAERPDKELAEQARQQRYRLPSAAAPPPLLDLFDDRHERPVRDDEVIEALPDAPLVLARLPVDLLGGELTEHALRLVGDELALCQHGGQVAILEVVV